MHDLYNTYRSFYLRDADCALFAVQTESLYAEPLALNIRTIFRILKPRILMCERCSNLPVVMLTHSELSDINSSASCRDRPRH
jgi:hypothetical protein